MIRINLLPFRAARKKENIRRQVFIFVSLFILIALALIYYNMMLGNKLTALQEKVDQTRTELNRTMKAAKEVDQIKKQIDTLEKKMAIIDRLEKGRTAPVEFVEEMSRLIVADKMWLVRLAENDKSVQMGGLALDNKTVAVFLRRLEESPLFSEVDLRQIQQTQKEEVSLKSFDIECKKAGVEPPQPNKKRK
ncbi:MAG: PilN domain-containing protein [Desulfobacterales bacterium]|jgi:type IV pilus assembly protein PilN